MNLELDPTLSHDLGAPAGAGAPFDAVVFDMDGVIFDTESLYFEAETEMLERRGQQFRVAVAQRIMGLPGLRAMELLRDAHGLAETPEELFAECQARFRALIATRLALMPGFSELLERLDGRKIPKAIATSTRRQLTSEMLGAFALEPRFRFVLTADDVTRGKPHPEVYELACRRLGTTPARTLVIEDSWNGTRSAAAAGCFCVAVPHPLARSLDFSHARLVIDHLRDARLWALV